MACVFYFSSNQFQKKTNKTLSWREQKKMHERERERNKLQGYLLIGFTFYLITYQAIETVLNMSRRGAALALIFHRVSFINPSLPPASLRLQIFGAWRNRFVVLGAAVAISTSSGKNNKRAIVVQLISACISLWISCTTTKKLINLFFFPLLGYRIPDCVGGDVDVGAVSPAFRSCIERGRGPHSQRATCNLQGWESFFWKGTKFL